MFAVTIKIDFLFAQARFRGPQALISNFLRNRLKCNNLNVHHSLPETFSLQPAGAHRS